MLHHDSPSFSLIKPQVKDGKHEEKAWLWEKMAKISNQPLYAQFTLILLSLFFWPLK